jgi:flagellar hook-associated protein 2
MPTIQSPGVGSGLDVNGLVSQLMAAERAPADNRLKRESTAIGTEISALGTLKGALSAFSTTLGPLKTVEAFSARTATSGDEKVFTASAKSGAAPSTYNIRVIALAKAHQIASTPFVDGKDTVIGAGALTITLGTDAFGVVIDPAKTKLSDIRDAINSASGNPGVQAAIVEATDGAHLVLTSAKTGLANKIQVATDAVDGLQQLTYNSPSDTAHYSQVSAAQDSTITIAGFTHTSATNVVSDAIDDVTLTLKAESAPATDVSLAIAANKDAATTRIKNFVSQYNAAFKQLNDLGKYDPQTGKAGPLLGDALVRSVVSELRRGISDAVPGISGQITSLAQIGVTTAKDGTLQLDETKLAAALATNFDDVGKIFGSTDGVAARLDALITKRLDAKAEIASRNTSLDKRSKAVTQRAKDLEVYLAKVEEVYRRQFTALDTAMAKMQSTSTYLTQQLSNLPRIG